MKNLFIRYRLAIAAALLILMAVLLHLRAQNLGQFAWIDRLVLGVLRPITNTTHAVGSGVENWLGRYILLVGVEEENKRLRARIGVLEEEVHHHLESSIQYQLLKEQLVFLQSPLNPKIFAQIIGQSLDGHQTLLIDKGLNQGVRRNFPVVLREGVVGRIQTVSGNQAIVQLILDRRHRFPVLLRANTPARKKGRSRHQNQASGATPKLNPLQRKLVVSYRGIVEGHGNTLNLKRVPILVPMQQGDRVVSSGLAGVFPKGLLVGYVMSVKRLKHELFQTALIAPAVNFKQIEGVFVVLRGAEPNSLPYFSQPQERYDGLQKR